MASARPLRLEGSGVAFEYQFTRQIGSPVGGAEFHFFQQPRPCSDLAAPKTGERPSGILNHNPRVIAVEAAAEVQKQVRSLSERVVVEWTKNQVQFWTGDGRRGGASDRLGSRSGRAHLPPE